jgi:hypothetical protein
LTSEQQCEPLGDDAFTTKFDSQQGAWLMRPPHWYPPIELSPLEQTIVARIRRAKLFIFLRSVRHELFDDLFQDELAEMFRPSLKGNCPVSPAKLALVTILQAYTGASDDEAIEALVMDRRWQLVLDCLECEQPPFSKGTLVKFRGLFTQKGLDRRLVERTVELATQRGGFSSRKLRAALDSSPLWGAARVEDTYNLLGHALRKALGVIARQQGRELRAVAVEAGAEIVTGSSLRAALDLNWDDSVERTQALELVLTTLEAVDSWVRQHPGFREISEIRQSLEAGQQEPDWKRLNIVRVRFLALQLSIARRLF